MGMPGVDRPGRGASRLDPRCYQIAILGGLLTYGLIWLDFEVRLANAVVILATALGAQYAGTKLWGLPTFDPKSALISGLSLCLLLRANSPLVAGVAAYLAVASKFVIRWDDKHVFNPTNFALVAMLSLDFGWVSPGQWGREAFFAFLVACLGGLVVNRAARSDVTYAFLASYVALVMGRAWWLGDPLAIPLHHLQNGALLIFAFFMISDPKTTPNARAGRMVFAATVALGALFVQFGLYRPNGLLWSLVCCAPAVPLLDRLFTGTRYDWSQSRVAAGPRIQASPALVRLAVSALIPSFLTGRGAR